MSAPKQCIFSAADIDKFKSSETHTWLVVFIKLIAESITGHANSSAQTLHEMDIMHPGLTSEHINDKVKIIQTFFHKLHGYVDEIPPIQQPMRFGNKAFRIWRQRLIDDAPSFLQSILPTSSHQHIPELSYYLAESFGSDMRIDYGTGHELNMIVFLFCLYKLKVFREVDARDVGLLCIPAYIKTMRRLQIDYVLEPAGSHGVWGLDDYHCLLYLFGAAQLRGNTRLSPSCIHDASILDELSGEYMYLEGIQFIRRVKHAAPFSETSPMLDDISRLSDWHKVYSGLQRLFEGEVIGKLPVVQHLFFGAVFPCTWEPDRPAAAQPVLHSSASMEMMMATKAPWAK